MILAEGFILNFLANKMNFPNPIDAVKNSSSRKKLCLKPRRHIQTTDTFETDDYLSEIKHFTSYIEELLNPFLTQIKVN